MWLKRGILGRGKPVTNRSNNLGPSSSRQGTTYGRGRLDSSAPRVRSKATGADLVGPGKEHWKQPVLIVPGSSQVRNVKPTTPITAETSIKSWGLYGARDAVIDPIPQEPLKIPAVNVHGVPDIPYLFITDQAEVMQTINESWAKPNKAEAVEILSANLRRTFRSSGNPFSEGLYFMVNSIDFRGTKNSSSLSYQVINELKKWLMEGEIVNFQKKCLKPDLQIVAFMIVTLQKTVELISIVCDVYRFDFIRDQLSTPIINLCKSGMYKQACHIATVVDVTSGIEVDDFVIPLIFQEREIFASDYLADHVDMQRQLMRFMNDMNAEKDVYNALKKYCLDRTIVGVKMESLKRPKFDKMLIRFQTKYKPIDDESQIQAQFEEIISEPNRKAITSLETYWERINEYSENFLENSMRKIDWDKVGENNTLSIPSPKDSRYVLEQLMDTETLHGRPISTLLRVEPTEFNDMLRISSSSELDIRTREQDFFYCIEINKRNVHYFHTCEGVGVFLKHLKGAQVAQKKRTGRWDDFLVVSFDAKWRILGKSRDGVSLLVIGLIDEIFILDLLLLKNFIREGELPYEMLRVFFFMNPGIVKIGYNHDKITTALAKTHPSWENMKTECKLFIDLNVLATRLIIKIKNFFPGVTREMDTGYGLSELIRISYGKPLNAETYSSNWDQRPLKSIQLKQAAVDGYALFHAMEFMKTRCTELEVDIEEIMISIMTSFVMPCHNFFTIPGRVKMFPHKLVLGDPVSPGTVKVVCDSMLLALGRKLRAAGMDCMIIGENEPSTSCVFLARRDDRSIITTVEGANEFRGHTPDGRCCELKSAGRIDQLKEVLEYFNIFVNDTDLYTRCQVCNCDHFVAVRNDTMMRLITKDKRHPSQNPTMVPNINNLISPCSEYHHQFKKWTLIHEGNIQTQDEKNIRTPSGAPIFFNTLTWQQVRSIVTFIICDDCGQIYLDESKHELMVGQKSTLKIPSSQPSGRSGASISSKNNSVSRQDTSVSHLNSSASRKGTSSLRQGTSDLPSDTYDSQSGNSYIDKKRTSISRPISSTVRHDNSSLYPEISIIPSITSTLRPGTSTFLTDSPTWDSTSTNTPSRPCLSTLLSSCLNSSRRKSVSRPSTSTMCPLFSASSNGNSTSRPSTSTMRPLLSALSNGNSTSGHRSTTLDKILNTKPTGNSVVSSGKSPKRPSTSTARSGPSSSGQGPSNSRGGTSTHRPGTSPGSS